MSLLEVRDLKVKYGSVEALKGISLEIADGEKCIALVGPNGAGKSTFVNAMTGLMKWEGTALYRGSSIAGLSNTQLVRAGVVQCPERRYLFDYHEREGQPAAGDLQRGQGQHRRACGTSSTCSRCWRND